MDPERSRDEPRSVEIIRVLTHDSPDRAHRARPNSAITNNCFVAPVIPEDQETVDMPGIPEDQAMPGAPPIELTNFRTRRVLSIAYPNGNDEVVEPTNEDEEGTKRPSTVVCRYGEGIDEVIPDDRTSRLNQGIRRRRLPPADGISGSKRPNTWGYPPRERVDEAIPGKRTKRPSSWAYGRRQNADEAFPSKGKNRLSVGVCRWGEGADQVIPGELIF